MDEAIGTVIGALIGAAAAIIGGKISGHREREIALEAWTQEREIAMET